MHRILPLLWEPLWVKCLILGLVALAVFGLVVWVREAMADDAVMKGLRAEFLNLEAGWPCFSSRAIECRIRAFCETYFLGWNAQDLSAIESHCAPEYYGELVADLRRRLAMGSGSPGSYERWKIAGFIIPDLYQILTPRPHRLATVVALSGVWVSSVLSKDRQKERRALVELRYHDSGDWRVHSLRFGNWQLRDAPSSDLDSSWMRANSMPPPSGATASPRRVLLEASIVRQTPRRGVVPVACSAITSIAVAAIGGWRLMRDGLDGIEESGLGMGAFLAASCVLLALCLGMSYAWYRMTRPAYSEFWRGWRD